MLKGNPKNSYDFLTFPSNTKGFHKGEKQEMKNTAINNNIIPLSLYYYIASLKDF